MSWASTCSAFASPGGARGYQDGLQQNASVLPVLRIGPATAVHYTEIRSELKSAGRPIPANDLWTAVLAREHGWAVLSRDRHFQAVAGLKLVSW
jgi:predicted nucleic acid-binding protein